jgi:hypothetical protein
MGEPLLRLLSSLAWPLLAVLFFIAYRSPIRRLANALVQRIERGDEVKIYTWLTLGRSAGQIKVPNIGDLITDAAGPV